VALGDIGVWAFCAQSYTKELFISWTKSPPLKVFQRDAALLYLKILSLFIRNLFFRGAKCAVVSKAVLRWNSWPGLVNVLPT